MTSLIKIRCGCGNPVFEICTTDGIDWELRIGGTLTVKCSKCGKDIHVQKEIETTREAEALMKKAMAHTDPKKIGLN